MAFYHNMSLDELRDELSRTEKKLEDARHERDFMGKLSGAHISASELSRLDVEIERFEKNITELKSRLA